MTIRIRGGCQGYEYIRAMALQEPSKVKKKGAERKRNSLRKNDRKVKGKLTLWFHEL